MKKIIVILCFFIARFHFNSIGAQHSVDHGSIVLSDSEKLLSQATMLILPTFFDELVQKAHNGDAQSQALVGFSYLNGLNPSFEKDIAKAEEWLLKARKKGHRAAHSYLVDVALDTFDYQKVCVYARDAISAGFINQYHNLGCAYSNLGKYKQAYDYFFQSITLLEPYKHIPELEKVYDCSLREVATLPLLGKVSCADNQLQKSLDILHELVKKNHVEAGYFLAQEYLTGNTLLKKDVTKAKSVLQQIIVNGKPESAIDCVFYNQCICMQGLIYEYHDQHPNVEKAAAYYRKSSNIFSNLQLVRLILTKKAPGNYDQAKDQLINIMHNIPNKLAAFIYANTLMLDGYSEEAVSNLEKSAHKKGDMHSLINMQLGLAYHYGFGVEKDEKRAQLFFNTACNDGNSRNRSTFVARGYLRLLGLGVKKDLKKGLDLIAESETKVDDVYFSTSEILPMIATIKDEYRQECLNALIDQEQNEKNKTRSVKITARHIDYLKELCSIKPADWNKHFTCTDGSCVESIDAKDKKFVIYDASRAERLHIFASTDSKKNIKNICKIDYHKRILERQGKNTKIKLDDKTKHDHTFAAMADYVIQYIGKLVPFSKPGTKETSDQYTAQVIREDLTSGTSTKGTLEYTFGQKTDNSVYLYHRLLRPERRATDQKLSVNNTAQ